MDDSRRPNCRKFSSTLCNLCYQADIRYSTRREEILEVRKIKNRQSAMRSRDNRALRWDDLVAENYALKQEEYEAEKALFDIEQEKRQLLADIHSKNLEKAWRMDRVASDVSRFIVLNPDETIYHLHQTFGSPVPYQQGIHGEPPTPGVVSTTADSAPMKHQRAGDNSQVFDPHSDQ